MFAEGMGFSDSSVTALNVAISGSILAEPEACLVIRIELPRGSTLALPQHQAIIGWPPWIKVPSASLRSAVLIAPCGPSLSSPAARGGGRAAGPPASRD